MAAAFALAYKVSGEEWQEKYWAENRLHLDTKTRLERDLEAYKLKLKQSNDELNLAYEDLAELKLQKSEPEDHQEEYGTYVVQRNLKARHTRFISSRI